MYELYEAAFSGVNVVYTTILILVLVYWGVVLLGILDMDALNIDVDLDVDAGADFDPSVDVDGGLEGSAGGFAWLAFLNVGVVPFVFYISLVALTMWVVSVQLHQCIDKYGAEWMKDYQGWIALAIAVPNFVFAVLFTKIILEPIKKFRNREPQKTHLVGKVGIVTTEEATGDFGRCELPKEEGSLILNIRTDGEVLRKGDPVEILELVRHPRGEYCRVKKKVWS